MGEVGILRSPPFDAGKHLGESPLVNPPAELALPERRPTPTDGGENEEEAVPQGFVRGAPSLGRGGISACS
eukprot:366431-Lingulodinium_polyedra.AAC.1